MSEQNTEEMDVTVSKDSIDEKQQQSRVEPQMEPLTKEDSLFIERNCSPLLSPEVRNITDDGKEDLRPYKEYTNWSRKYIDDRKKHRIIENNNKSNKKRKVAPPQIPTDLLNFDSLTQDSYIELTGPELLGTLLINALKTVCPSATMNSIQEIVEKNAGFFSSQETMKIYTNTHVTEMTSQDLRAHLLLKSANGQSGMITMEHIRRLVNEQKAYFDSGEIVHIFSGQM